MISSGTMRIKTFFFQSGKLSLLLDLSMSSTFQGNIFSVPNQYSFPRQSSYSESKQRTINLSIKQTVLANTMKQLLSQNQYILFVHKFLDRNNFSLAGHRNATHIPNIPISSSLFHFISVKNINAFHHKIIDEDTISISFFISALPVLILMFSSCIVTLSQLLQTNSNAQLVSTTQKHK